MNTYFDPLASHRPRLLSSLAETIKAYYPIGVDPFNAEYHQYPGRIWANEIIAGHVMPEGKIKTALSDAWRLILKTIKAKNANAVEGTTFGFVPGFSADLILERYEDESLTRTKRIAFAVSMLGPFYSVCGVDETVIIDGPDEYGLPRYYEAINVVTGSPYKEFEKDFLRIEQIINKHLPDYQFVPFNYSMLFVKGVKGPDTLRGEANIYELLFNNRFRFYTHYKCRGDGYYGTERGSDISVVLTAPPLGE